MSFIIANGNSNDSSIYDTGVLPTTSEDVYVNGFTVQVIGNFSVNSVRNNTSDYYLPNTAIPIMTSATSPSGIVTVSGQVVGFEGWRAFDRNNTTLWQTTAGATTGTLSYQFPSSKIIKRYSFRNSGAGVGARNFTFEASNDGSSWTTLDTQTSINVGANGIFTSSVLANTTAYLYYRINITTVNGGTTIQMSEFEMTTSTSLTVGQTAGGTFILNNASNLTTTATEGIVSGSTTPVVQFTAGAGNSATINSGVVNPVGYSTGFRYIQQSGLGTLTINGSYICPSTVSANIIIINLTSTGITYINGDLSSNAVNTASDSSTLVSTSAGTIYINGAITGSASNRNASATVYSSGGATIIHTGNQTAGIGNCITCIGGTLIEIGNQTASSTKACIINITTATTIDITGTPTAGTGANAIIGLGLVKVSGNPVNTNRYMAIYAPQITIDTATTSWKFQEFTGVDITLYASGASLGNPALGDVRFGTVYGPSGTLTGTLRVPNPNTVLLGTLTDATTGTLLMTPQDFWDFLTSGSTLIGSFGKLIKDFLDIAVSSRLASASYTAPDNTSIAAIKVKTDTINWTNITDIKTKTDSINWSDITSIKTKTDTIVWSDITGIVTTTGLIKAKTDTILWADITAIKTKTDTINWTNITDVKFRTDKIPNFPASVQTTGDQIASYIT